MIKPDYLAIRKAYGCFHQWALFLFYGLACLVITGCQPKLAINTPYHEARDIIIQSGWTPVINETPDEEIGFHALALRQKGYVEVDDCSGTGKGYCLFHFQYDDKILLSVTTQELPAGETDPSINNKDDAIVISYEVRELRSKTIPTGKPD